MFVEYDLIPLHIIYLIIFINPFLTNGLSHLYHLGESTFIFRGVRNDFLFIFFLSHFSIKFFCANRIAPDGTPRSAASHLELCCLPMSQKKDARLTKAIGIAPHSKRYLSSRRRSVLILAKAYIMWVQSVTSMSST